MSKRVLQKVAAIVFTFALALVAVLGTDFGLGSVKAISGYTVTFQVATTNTGTHTIEEEGGHLKIDGQFVDLKDGDDNVIGTVSVNNGVGTIAVLGGSAGTLNYNPANSFDLYNTNGHVKHNYSDVISEDTVYLVEDYVAPGGNNNPNPGGGGNNAAPGKYDIHIEQNCGGPNPFEGEIWVSFIAKANPTVILNNGGNPQAFNGDAGDLDIPAGADTLIIEFAQGTAADAIENFQNANVEVFRGDSRTEFDAFDQMRRQENADHNFVLNSDQQINVGNTFVQGMDIDPTTDHIRISIIFSNTRSVSWSYDSNAAEDQYVQHCRIYRLNGDDPSTVVDGTDFQLTIGEDFYFLLVPDYGYQVTGLLVNGWIPIEPMNSCGVFKFSMVNSNFHFNAMVSPADDITDVSGAAEVSEVSIGDGANATANGGNLKVTVADAATPSGVSNVASGTVLSTVDIDVDNIVSKGNGEYWSSDVTELSNPIQVGLKLSDAKNGTYAVVREHNGTLTKVDASYDAASGVLTFPSDAFSSFTIVRTGDATETEKTEKTEEPASTYTGPTLQSVANKPYETGKLYADNATLPASTAVHPSKGVTITGIAAITDQAALTKLAEEVNYLYQLTKTAGYSCTKSFAMDLKASGSGSVAFDVGVTGTAAAVISHYHDGIWTRQIVDVVNGQATGYFNSFSPVYINVYEGVTANQLRAAGIAETEVKGASPKTGQQNTLWVLLLVAGAAVAVILFTMRGEKSKQKD